MGMVCMASKKTFCDDMANACRKSIHWRVEKEGTVERYLQTLYIHKSRDNITCIFYMLAG